MNKKIIVIIGASSGIGFSTVAGLSIDKNNIVICSSRNIENHFLGNRSENIILKNIDVASEDSVKDFFKFIAENYKKVDTIINCAGFVEPKGLFEISLDAWKKTIDINLTGVFNVTKFGCLLMKKTGGKLINIASTAGLTPRPGWGAYAAAKSGVINFSATMAEELKDYGIRVYCLCPGRTATSLRKILVPNEDPSKIMQPEAVADVIVGLLNDSANVMEGQAIIVRDRY